MKILILNGPNLNMLGIREPEIYGVKTYGDLCAAIDGYCRGNDYEIYQSNSEGKLVDKIQSAYGEYSTIVINAAAYTHTSIAILDALKAVGIPTVEVHLSDTDNREDFRKQSYISLYAEKVFKGKGFESYRDAIDYVIEKYGRN